MGRRNTQSLAIITKPQRPLIRANANLSFVPPLLSKLSSTIAIYNRSSDRIGPLTPEEMEVAGPANGMRMMDDGSWEWEPKTAEEKDTVSPIRKAVATIKDSMENISGRRIKAGTKRAAREAKRSAPRKDNEEPTSPLRKAWGKVMDTWESLEQKWALRRQGSMEGLYPRD